MSTNSPRIILTNFNSNRKLVINTNQRQGNSPMLLPLSIHSRPKTTISYPKFQYSVLNISIIVTLRQWILKYHQSIFFYQNLNISKQLLSGI